MCSRLTCLSWAVIRLRVVSLRRSRINIHLPSPSAQQICAHPLKCQRASTRLGLTCSTSTWQSHMWAQPVGLRPANRVRGICSCSALLSPTPWPSPRRCSCKPPLRQDLGKILDVPPEPHELSFQFPVCTVFQSSFVTGLVFRMVCLVMLDNVR